MAVFDQTLLLDRRRRTPRDGDRLASGWTVVRGARRVSLAERGAFLQLCRGHPELWAEPRDRDPATRRRRAAELRAAARHRPDPVGNGLGTGAQHAPLDRAPAGADAAAAHGDRLHAELTSSRDADDAGRLDRYIVRAEYGWTYRLVNVAVRATAVDDGRVTTVGPTARGRPGGVNAGSSARTAPSVLATTPNAASGTRRRAGPWIS